MTSRVERTPLTIPKGVEVFVEAEVVRVKGAKGTLTSPLSPLVSVTLEGQLLSFAPKSNDRSALVIAGTTRALIKNMIIGVSDGFTIKLILEGVGYKANIQGKVLTLTIGLSHLVQHTLADGVTAEIPTQTEIVLKSSDKQLIGQEAATIRRYRPPECYKGKGIRYDGEVIVFKEGKKK